VLDGPTSGVGVIRVVAPDPERRSSDATWAGERAQSVRRQHASLHRYVQNLPLPPENGVRWGLDCRAVEELWFDDIAAIRREWAAIQPTPADAQRTPIVIVREALLHPHAA
jgi:hypothetical protein